jgi:hypothetical protein
LVLRQIDIFRSIVAVRIILERRADQLNSAFTCFVFVMVQRSASGLVLVLRQAQ